MWVACDRDAANQCAPARPRAGTDSCASGSKMSPEAASHHREAFQGRITGLTSALKGPRSLAACAGDGQGRGTTRHSTGRTRTAWGLWARPSKQSAPAAQPVWPETGEHGGPAAGRCALETCLPASLDRCALPSAGPGVAEATWELCSLRPSPRADPGLGANTRQGPYPTVL